MNKRYLHRFSLFFITTVLLATSSFVDVSAYDSSDAAKREQMYIDYRLGHYGGGTSAACSGSIVAGETNVHKIWNYLVKKGLSNEQAAGVLGNIQEESGFSATRQEASQTFPRGGWGIVQWTGTRRANLIAELGKFDNSLLIYYAANYGGPTAEATGYRHPDILEDANTKLLDFELDFLYQEATTRPVIEDRGFRGSTDWDALKNAKSLREASDVFLYSFERPTDQSESHAQDRASNGQAIYDKIMANPTALTKGGSCMTGSVNELQSLVLEYAWPDYMGRGHTSLRPKYAEAVQQGRENQMYIGANGVDCGAFTTLLIVNSKFDSKYNHSGLSRNGAGNTDTQEAWVKENWQALNTSSTPIDTAILQPGDVAFTTNHTFIYVGKIDGFNSDIASASQGSRSPMAGAENKTLDGEEIVRWYRKA